MTADRTEPANLESERGGLVIRGVAASLDQDFTMYNDNEPATRSFLAQSDARSITVPHHASRAVIFDSDPFHEPERIAFQDGYTNRRLNITSLSGRRRSHEG